MKSTQVTTKYDNGDSTTDDESKIGTGAIKYDAGKPCVYRGLVEYFPRAGMAVAEISTFGANKYAWNGWSDVDDGVNRYSDAMMRHLLQEAMGEEYDNDSGLLHAAHAAWGAFARLELMLRKQENYTEKTEDVYDLDEDKIVYIDEEGMDAEVIRWMNDLMKGQNNV